MDADASSDLVGGPFAGLAISANTALFGIFDQLIRRPHSFKDPETLVRPRFP